MSFLSGIGFQAMLGGVAAPIDDTPVFPDWLPQAPSGDRPVVYADFKNGHYWADNASTSVSHLFEQNNDFWGNFDFAAIISGSGLGDASDAGTSQGNPVLLRPLSEPINAAGYTVVFAVQIPEVADFQWSIAVASADFPDLNTQTQAVPAGTQPPSANDIPSYFGRNGDFAGPDGLTTSGTHRIAFTVPASLTTLTFSVDGSAGEDVEVAPAGTPPTDIAINVNNLSVSDVNHPYLVEIAWYAVQPGYQLTDLTGS